MILIQGYMGNVLYTGDLRYDQSIMSNYNYLYPLNKRTADFKKCSIPIDFLYLDVTYLHPKYVFPSKQTALNMIEDFISETIQNAKK